MNMVEQLIQKEILRGHLGFYVMYMVGVFAGMATDSSASLFWSAIAGALIIWKAFTP
jgi:hypothetical protein